MTSEVLAREELDIDWLEVEFQKRMDEKGYVLLWSELFQDFVAFYMKSEVLNNIPDKYVTYSDQELKDLFSEGKSLSQKKLKFIHNIKKVFGSVILIERTLRDRENLNLHCFRHARAATLYEQGVDITVGI